MNSPIRTRCLLLLVLWICVGNHAWGQFVPEFLPGKPRIDNTDDPALVTAFTLKAHHTSAAALTFSPDGKTLASISNDGTVKLWNVKDQSQSGLIAGFSVKGRGQADRAICFSPDGKLLAAGVSGVSIKVADVASRKIQWSQDVGARSIAYSPDGDSIVTTDWESPWVNVWNAQTGKSIAKLQGSDADIQPGGSSQGSVAFAPDGKTFTTVIGKGGSVLPRLVVWDSQSRTAEYQFNAESTRVNAMQYSRDSQSLAIGSIYGQILVFRVVRALKEEVDDVEIAKLISKLDDDKFTTRESAQRELLKYGDAILEQVRAASTKSMSVEKRFRISAILGTISSRKSVPSAVLYPLDGAVMGIEFSQDGRLLAACSRSGLSANGSIALWNTSNLTTPIFYSKGKGFNSIAFSPDGKLLATACHDGTIIVWNCKDKR